MIASSVVSTPSKTLLTSAENAAPPVTAISRPPPRPFVLRDALAQVGHRRVERVAVARVAQEDRQQGRVAPELGLAHRDASGGRFSCRAARSVRTRRRSASVRPPSRR